MLNDVFLSEFRRKTEGRWSELILNPLVYGFQIRPRTRWNAGLSKEEIDSYEGDVGIEFPEDFKKFLHEMNGTDLPLLNVYGGSGEAHREATGVYSYPRDLALVRNMIDLAVRDRETLRATLEDQGVVLDGADKFMPIFQHRFIMCTQDPRLSVVLSIWDSKDAVVYGSSLGEYLEREFLLKP